MLPMLVAAVTLTYASTPQRAAVGAMYSDPKKPAVVRRVNLVGRYAAVLTSGGRIEGEFVTGPIVVEHFSFGWQPLALWESRCYLQDPPLGSGVAEQLMRGMPAVLDDRPCHGRFLKDAGPPSEVDAVRKLIRGPLVPYVVVAGDWAMGEWYGAGGGEALYHQLAGRWKVVEDGGGAMGVDYMRKYGVPQSAWCKFGIFDAKCGGK